MSVGVDIVEPAPCPSLIITPFPHQNKENAEVRTLFLQKPDPHYETPSIRDPWCRCQLTLLGGWHLASALKPLVHKHRIIDYLLKP